jgi:choice-of-anchor B domain-containing protein
MNTKTTFSVLFYTAVGLSALTFPVNLTVRSAPLGEELGGLELVGQDRLGVAPNGDIWVHGQYAYLGTAALGTTAGCGAGVKVVDISDPAHPQPLSPIVTSLDSDYQDVAVISANTQFFQGDLLAAGLQVCRSGGARGVQFWDGTDPRRPRRLGFVETGAASGGVHELSLLQRENRVFALLAVPGSEARGEGGDFRIVEATDPRNPRQIADWGIEEDLGLIRSSLGQGDSPSVFCHSAAANVEGTVAYLSYWDAGIIILDISDPSKPRFIGRTMYAPGEEGNAHSIWLASSGKILLVADEDVSPGRGRTESTTWGFLRLYDLSDLAHPRQISTFVTQNTQRFPPPDAGWYTVHNPFVVGDTAYLSWYSDGVRVVDISDPANPREIAFFVPPPQVDRRGFLGGRPAVWGVYVQNDLIFISDINTGLYILRRQ